MFILVYLRELHFQSFFHLVCIGVLSVELLVLARHVDRVHAKVLYVQGYPNIFLLRGAEHLGVLIQSNILLLLLHFVKEVARALMGISSTHFRNMCQVYRVVCHWGFVVLPERSNPLGQV